MSTDALDLANPRLLKAVESVHNDMENNSEFERKATQVIKRFGKLFHPDGLPSLSAEDVWAFLCYNGDSRYWGIHRHVSTLTSDMSRLRDALGILLNDKKPLDERLRKLRPSDEEPAIPGLARSVISPILHVVYPQKYCVLNRRAEEAMKLTGVYPTISPKADFARIYITINEAMISIAKEFSLPLWALDNVWARIVEDEGGSSPAASAASADDSFGIERHLHAFILDNWDSLGISEEWELYERDGEIVGSQYRTEFGRISLLARHIKRPEWLVIELKRDDNSDAAIGQMLRYMGWVQRYLAGKEVVKGMIISKHKDTALDYALVQLPNVSSKIYRVTIEIVDSEGEELSQPQADDGKRVKAESYFK
jgi:hypothetical protein